MNWKLIEKADLLLSKEKGTIFKDPGGKINIALVYPNTYHLGMSNLGFQGIYGLLNNMSDIVCERVFLPEEKDIEEFVRTNTELFSIESKRQLSSFDIIAFSISFENDYPNILKIFSLAGIPFYSSERTENHPLIIMGGVCAFLNPEPVADFFDIVFIGEADEMLFEFINICKISRGKKDILHKTLSLEGFYIPSFYHISFTSKGTIAARKALHGAPNIIKRRYLSDISKSKISTSIITPETEFSEMSLIEAMRGCPWRCRFCAIGNIYNPPRRKDLIVIRQQIQNALEKSKKVGLIGPSLSDYPYIKDALQISGVDFSITSLRAGTKSAELFKLIKGHRSVSIAPEAGTDKLRKVINKKITEEDILYTTEKLFHEGIETLRLYFMIGLPTETEEDIEGIVKLIKKIRIISAKGFITLSISTFVPKPFTPFQWHTMEKEVIVKKRLMLIKKGVSQIKGVKVFHDIPKYSYMQGLFSLGNRHVSKVIVAMVKQSDWIRALEESGINKEFFLFRKKEFSEILPWDFIDNGIPKIKLWEEYQEALF